MASGVVKQFLFIACLVMMPAATWAMGSGGGGGAPMGGTMGASPADQTRQQYKKAVKAIENGDFASAEMLLADYVTKRKKSADAWNYLAYAQRNLGKHDEAMENYNTALELDPKHKGALEYQGELYLKLSNVAAAQANLERLSTLCKKKKKCEERDVLQASIERAKDGKVSWQGPGAMSSGL